jgi:hypothetical protein
VLLDLLLAGIRDLPGNQRWLACRVGSELNAVIDEFVDHVAFARVVVIARIVRFSGRVPRCDRGRDGLRFLLKRAKSERVSEETHQSSRRPNKRRAASFYNSISHMLRVFPAVATGPLPMSGYREPLAMTA